MGAPKFVVVGGGITGAFTAYFLARTGAEVALVERAGIGTQASGNNPGGLNPLYGPGIPGPMRGFALDSFQLHISNWGSIEQSASLEFRAKIKERLNLAFEESDFEHLQDLQTLYEGTPSFGYSWVDPDQISTIEPRIDRDVKGGLLATGDGRVDAHRYTLAVTAAAEALGTTIVHREACAITSQGSRLTGVKLGDRVLSCDGLVVATGPWVSDPERWLGLDLPVQSIKGEMLLAESADGAVPVDIAWRDAGVYQDRDNRMWLAASDDQKTLDPHPSSSARSYIIERVRRLLPSVDSFKILERRAGLRPVTPDGLPIVGRAPGWDNVCLALGGGRKGMLMSAGIGSICCRLLTGVGSTLDVEALRPERFDRAGASFESRLR